MPRQLGCWRLVGLCLLLLSSPAVVSGQDTGRDELDSRIADAAEAQDWAKFEQLLQAGAPVDSVQPDGTTALHWIVLHRHDSALQRLISAGAEVERRNYYQVSALSLACEYGHDSLASQLIDAGANIEQPRLAGERPLMLAAKCGSVATIHALVEAGAELDAREQHGQTALMWAAAWGHAEAVQTLIELGADQSIRTKKSGFNAFLFAAREGRLEVVDVLLKHGAEVDQVLKPQRTSGRNPRKAMSAQMLAMESGHFELALQLVDRGANPNDQRSGYAPLHALTWVRKTRRGDDPSGDPPPREAGSLSSLEFARKLIQAGADPNLKLKRGSAAGKAKLNHLGATPLLLAAATADLDYVELLLEAGADASLANADQCNALMAAAGIGAVAVGEEPGTESEVLATVSRLAELGLDINHVDKNGETAMHGAAYRCYPGVIAQLAKLGADPGIWNQPNRHRWTPFDIGRGKRPGSVKPSPETLEALDRAAQSTPDRN